MSPSPQFPAATAPWAGSSWARPQHVPSTHGRVPSMCPAPTASSPSPRLCGMMMRSHSTQPGCCPSAAGHGGSQAGSLPPHGTRRHRLSRVLEAVGRSQTGSQVKADRILPPRAMQTCASPQHPCTLFREAATSPGKSDPLGLCGTWAACNPGLICQPLRQNLPKGSA